MKRNVLLIDGHPAADSYCGALCDAYAEGFASKNGELRRQTLRDLDFEPIFRGYGSCQPMEADLAQLQADISWADHITFVYPLWWGGMPALLKSVLDRVLLPGFAFRYTSKLLPPRQLLKGKTARLLVTMDSPPPLYRWVLRAPGHRQMKQIILGFCGIKTVGVHDIGPVKLAPAALREHWLRRARGLGKRDSNKRWSDWRQRLQYRDVERNQITAESVAQ